jgi:FkbM family methyltransferase
MMLRKVLGTTHHLLAHSNVGLHTAVKLRNQCEAIIARAHGTTIADSRQNGESDFIAKMAPDIKYFVDVGANQGGWTAMLLECCPSANGLLFDPSHSASSILRQRFKGMKTIEVQSVAVGDVPGCLPFFEEEGAGETSSLMGAVSKAKEGRQVPVTTIDCEIRKHHWPYLDYLKIDAEGYDFHALMGAKELFLAGNIHFGQFEYGTGWRFAGATLTHALTWLASMGYETYLLTKTGLRRPDPDRFREYFRYSNYVFVREDLKYRIIQDA